MLKSETSGRRTNLWSHVNIKRSSSMSKGSHLIDQPDLSTLWNLWKWTSQCYAALATLFCTDIQKFMLQENLINTQCWQVWIILVTPSYMNPGFDKRSTWWSCIVKKHNGHVVISHIKKVSPDDGCTVARITILITQFVQQVDCINEITLKSWS